MPPGATSTTALPGMAGPCPTGCVTIGLGAGSRDPQDTQKRLPTGLCVEQVVQTGPSSSRVSKLKAGASGRERAPKPASAPYSAGSGTTPRPTGGVGGTSPAGDARRRPQSWQNARFSGLLRPQRSQITSPKGNPQDIGTSSTFQCRHLGRAGGRTVSHTHGERQRDRGASAGANRPLALLRQFSVLRPTRSRSSNSAMGPLELRRRRRETSPDENGRATSRPLAPPIGEFCLFGQVLEWAYGNFDDRSGSEHLTQECGRSPARRLRQLSEELWAIP